MPEPTDDAREYPTPKQAAADEAEERAIEEMLAEDYG